MNPNRLSPYVSFITDVAYQAGRLTLGYYQTGLQVEYKADASPVTMADRKTEEYIRSRIEAAFPEHAIVGEEYGLKETQGASHRWFIDPIDGTKSFMRGIPLYAVLIGLEIEGKVEVGAAYFPALDEMLCAATGLGCWWNGRPAHVSPVTSLERAMITVTSTRSFYTHNRKAEFERLLDKCYFQTGVGDAYGYLLVATGRAEVMLDPIMSVWDCGPFPPILSEAGGYFGDWKGNPTIYGCEAMATTQALLPQVVELLNQ
ncbi:MAG: inositol monophosphatase family protein [Chloroflexota bacterium]